MSVLVPLIFAVLFLILQMVLYAHDTVWVDAWICTKNQEVRWQLESGERSAGESQTADDRADEQTADDRADEQTADDRADGGEEEEKKFAECLFARMPKLTVLRQESVSQTEGGNQVATQAVFRFCLLPDEIRMLVSDFPEKVERRVTDPVEDLAGWIRQTGALWQ